MPQIACVLKRSSQRLPDWRAFSSSIRRCGGGTVLGGREGGDLGDPRGGCAGEAHREAFGQAERVAAEVHRGCGRQASHPAGTQRAAVVVGGTGGDLSWPRGGVVVAGDRCRVGALPVDGVSRGQRQWRGVRVSGVASGSGRAAAGVASPPREAGAVSAVAAGGGTQARGDLVTRADLGVVGFAVSRRPGDAGVSRDHLPVVVRAGPGRVAPRAAHLSAVRAGDAPRQGVHQRRGRPGPAHATWS